MVKNHTCNQFCQIAVITIRNEYKGWVGLNYFLTIKIKQRSANIRIIEAYYKSVPLTLLSAAALIHL